MFEIVDALFVHAGRRILIVEVDGHRIPFYKSTGRNSGKEGTWFPYFGHLNGWFVKPLYNPSLMDDFKQDKRFHQRYGHSPRMKEVSEWLATQHHPDPMDPVDAMHVNRWLISQDARVSFNVRLLVEWSKA